MHTTVKAERDTCYDKGKKEICGEKKNRSLELSLGTLLRRLYRRGSI